MHYTNVESEIYTTLAKQPSHVQYCSQQYNYHWDGYYGEIDFFTWLDIVLYLLLVINGCTPLNTRIDGAILARSVAKQKNNSQSSTNTHVARKTIIRMRMNSDYVVFGLQLLYTTVLCWW